MLPRRVTGHGAGFDLAAPLSSPAPQRCQAGSGGQNVGRDAAGGRIADQAVRLDHRRRRSVVLGGPRRNARAAGPQRRRQDDHDGLHRRPAGARRRPHRRRRAGAEVEDSQRHGRLCGPAHGAVPVAACVREPGLLRRPVRAAGPAAGRGGGEDRRPVRPRLADRPPGERPQRGAGEARAPGVGRDP